MAMYVALNKIADPSHDSALARSPSSRIEVVMSKHF
jgi:hypothetical protein